MSDSSPATTRRCLLRAGAALAATTGLGGCMLSTEPYTASEDRTFDVGDADAVAVVNDRGDVSLTAGDDDAVSGTVRKESRSGRDALDEVTVETRTEDGTFVVAPDSPDDENVTVHVDLTVPADLPVDRAVTTNGAATVTDVTGDVTCRSRNGEARAEGVDGYVTVETTNGAAVARDTTGIDGAETTNGGVRVDVRDVRDDVALESTNGGVTAAVDPDLSVAVDLQTTNGSVSVQDFDLGGGDQDEGRIRGELGDGDAEHTLTLETTNGDATLRSL